MINSSGERIMKQSFKITVAALAAALFASVCGPAAAQQPTSMRGAQVDAVDKAPTDLQYQGKKPGLQDKVARTFEGQPPVIPHALANFDEITLEENQCMSCHSAAKYQEKKAPKVGDSHFIDREGKKLPDISMARHNCTQCHVPQVDAPPLVANDFVGYMKPVAAAKPAAKAKPATKDKKQQ
jgi:cytochrome c-type protein NapB